MIKFEELDIVGWEHAIRGMRNPMNSWAKSDSGYLSCFEANMESGDTICNKCGEVKSNKYCVGSNDYDLMMRLRNAGTDHRKFMRMITVYVDITAPLYWWKEFDTYKVGTVANSCSTMHKVMAKEFTIDDFSHEHLFSPADIGWTDCWIKDNGNVINRPVNILELTINMLNKIRVLYLWYSEKAKEGDQSAKEHLKDYWWQIIQLLPSSYNQKRTVELNYEVLANIYKSRKNHKLDEWVKFCEWIETLPFSELITGINKNGVKGE